jgi:hypothetical protein
VLALKKETVGAPSQLDVDLGCLVEHCAEVEESEVAQLARILAAYYDRFPVPYPVAEPVEDLVEIAKHLLRARTTQHLRWWRQFWSGMGAAGGGLRAYIYLAAGTVYGVRPLESFIEATIEWEDETVQAGAVAPAVAGSVLRGFRGPEVPSVHQMFPTSPRMRRVILTSVPFEFLTLGELHQPWFASDEAQQRLRELWNNEQFGSEWDREAWRTEYIGSEWVLAGYDVALGNLSAAFSFSEDPIAAFSHESKVRFQAAVAAYSGYLGSHRYGVNQKAEALRLVLAEAVRRATPKALTSLVYMLDAFLRVPGMRAHVARLMQDRLDELPHKVRSILEQQ